MTAHQSEDFRQAIVNALRAHRIECTGPGEVTCSCREGGWMPMSAFVQHQADAVLDALGLERAYGCDPLCESCDGDGYVVDFDDAAGGTLDCHDCGPLYRLRVLSASPVEGTR